MSSVELLTGPPPAEAIATMLGIDGVQIAGAALSTQSGPEHHLGPEGAGAILILQATFVHRDGFDAFWCTAADLMQALATTSGFIRRYSFADGPQYTLIALWRTVEDANAFFASDGHQAAVRGLHEHRWQYTHFASLWAPVVQRQRTIFCQNCHGVVSAPATHCDSCGLKVVDPFKESA